VSKVKESKSIEFWQSRQLDCVQVLEKLLATEFTDVKDKIVIMLDFVDRRDRAGDVETNWIFKGIALIRIQTRNWLLYPDFTKRYLVSLIRHELLHLSTGLGDDDPEFQKEARRRGIDIRGIIYGEQFDLLTKKKN